MVAADTRARIIETADQLFYEGGFDHTSFADIATEVGISRGNFYYHFRTKDEILDAVIEQRLADRRAMLDQWELAADTPCDCIASFIRILLMNEKKIRAYGCPIGTLTLELSKLGHTGESRARHLFDLFRAWLKRHFKKAGCDDETADRHALHVLGRSQGIATLANTYPDEDYLERETENLLDWLDDTLRNIPHQSIPQ